MNPSVLEKIGACIRFEYSLKRMKGTAALGQVPKRTPSAWPSGVAGATDDWSCGPQRQLRAMGHLVHRR
jgi:hypothetical protein